ALMPKYTGSAKEMKQENQDEGKELHEQTIKALQDKMLHGATEQERFQAEKDLAEYKRRTPWGGDESSHPGLLGKIGHIAARVGEGALDAYAGPNATATLVPGSKEGLTAESARAAQGVEQAQKTEAAPAELALKQAQAARTGEVPLDQQMIKEYDELDAANQSGDSARIEAANTRLDHL